MVRYLPIGWAKKTEVFSQGNTIIFIAGFETNTAVVDTIENLKTLKYMSWISGGGGAGMKRFTW